MNFSLFLNAGDSKQSASAEAGAPTFRVNKFRVNKWWLVCIVLWLMVVTTALAVVFSSYKARQLFSELQQLNKQTVQLEEQWGRLLLEQSTWASHSRIEELAKTRLNMRAPEPAAIVVIEQ